MIKTRCLNANEEKLFTRKSTKYSLQSLYFLHRVEHFLHGVERFLHGVERFLHRVECFLHRVEHFLHRVEHFLHRVKHFLHRVERFLHGVERFLHGVERFLHRVERFLHRVECFLHRVERFLHGVECFLRGVEQYPPLCLNPVLENKDGGKKKKLQETFSRSFPFTQLFGQRPFLFLFIRRPLSNRVYRVRRRTEWRAVFCITIPKPARLFRLC